MSDNTVLIFDAKCPLCTSLATKIRSVARRPIELRALTDPVAADLLDGFYPHGWEHDFYLIDERGCGKGVRSLRRLRKHVGARQLSALISEYGLAKVSAKRMALTHDHSDEGSGSTSRRKVLKGAALAAVAVPLAGMPRIASAFEQPSASQVVNFVEGNAKSGSVALRAWANDRALRRTERFDRSPEHAAGVVRRDGERVLRDVVIPRVGPMRIDTATIHKQRDVAGGVEKRSMVTYNAALDADRYHISVYAGYGDLDAPEGLIKGATMAVGIRHDLASPVADVVTLADGQKHGIQSHLSTYSSSLAELRTLHEKSGRRDFVSLYSEIEQGFARLMAEFLAVAPHEYQPMKNRMVISATPEILKFVDYPATFVSVIPQGCDCSCSCGLCCAVGCGIGFCIPPKPCGPGCCISCGCGCGCCL
jgi:hypothetical protein